MCEGMKTLVALAAACFAVTLPAAKEGDAQMPLKGVRFTHLAFSSNVVSFVVSLPPGLDVVERKLDLVATQDMGTNDWKLVGCYDIMPNQTELTGELRVGDLPFPSSSRLFLALRAHVSDAGVKRGEAKRRLLGGRTASLVDTDGDGLVDSFELGCVPPLDPLNPDCDGDGYIDGEELLAGTSPLSHDDGSGITIRYYYDSDDRLTGSYSGAAQAASAGELSPAGNQTRQTLR